MTERRQSYVMKKNRRRKKTPFALCIFLSVPTSNFFSLLPTTSNMVKMATNTDRVMTMARIDFRNKRDMPDPFPNYGNFKSSLFLDDELSRHVFVAVPAKDIAMKGERACLVGNESDRVDLPRDDVGSNPELGAAEPVKAVQ